MLPILARCGSPGVPRAAWWLIAWHIGLRTSFTIEASFVTGADLVSKSAARINMEFLDHDCARSA
jgi:hypothetical protein